MYTVIIPFGVLHVSKTAIVTEVSTSESRVQSAELRQHVIFPNHFQVPEALKGGLTFGSFDTLGPSERSSSATGGDSSTSPTPESSLGNDEAAIPRFVVYMILVCFSFSLHSKLHMSRTLFPHAF